MSEINQDWAEGRQLMISTISQFSHQTRSEYEIAAMRIKKRLKLEILMLHFCLLTRYAASYVQHGIFTLFT
jgi:hypothetical protein